MKFMRRLSERRLGGGSLRCVDARLAPLELPDPKVDGSFAKNAARKRAIDTYSRGWWMTKARGADRTFIDAAAISATEEVGEIRVCLLRGAQREI